MGNTLYYPTHIHKQMGNPYPPQTIGVWVRVRVLGTQWHLDLARSVLRGDGLRGPRRARGAPRWGRADVDPGGATLLEFFRTRVRHVRGAALHLRRGVGRGFARRGKLLSDTGAQAPPPCGHHHRGARPRPRRARVPPGVCMSLAAVLAGAEAKGERRPHPPEGPAWLRAAEAEARSAPWRATSRPSAAAPWRGGRTR